MARLLTSGLDAGVAATDGWSTDDVAPAYSTTTKRGPGARSLFYHAASDSAVFPVTASSYYARWYVLITAYPTGGVQLIAYNYNTEYAIGLNSSGQVGLFAFGGSSFAGTPVTVPLNTWARVEFFVQVNTSGTDSAECRVNGLSTGTDSGSDRGSVANQNLAISAYDVTDSLAGTYYVDDVAINDTTTGSNNSWVGPSDGVTSVSAAAAITAVGAKGTAATSSVTGQGFWSAVGRKASSAVAALTGSGFVSALGFKGSSGTAGLSGSGLLTAAGANGGTPAGSGGYKNLLMMGVG